MGLCCCKTNSNKADSTKNEKVLRAIKGSNNEGFNKGRKLKKFDNITIYRNKYLIHNKPQD